VEELLAERGLDVSYEAVRRRVLKFGPLIARAPVTPKFPTVTERSLGEKPGEQQCHDGQGAPNPPWGRAELRSSG
jgi:hypothetical protein